jgi:hypothetical protein
LQVQQILQELDREIARLQQARALLAGEQERPRRGRPKGSGQAAKATNGRRGARRMTPEGRQRIAEAMRKRWAERKKTGNKSNA